MLLLSAMMEVSVEDRETERWGRWLYMYWCSDDEQVRETSEPDIHHLEELWCG
jgi:hypothetical protein